MPHYYAWRCQSCGSSGLFLNERPTTDPSAYRTAVDEHRRVAPFCPTMSVQWREATEQDLATNHYLSPDDLAKLADDIRMALAWTKKLRFGPSYGHVSSVGQDDLRALYDRLQAAMNRLPPTLR